MSDDLLPVITADEATGELAVKAQLIAAAATLGEQTVVEPVTLEEAKSHLRVFGDDEDSYITSLITAAREMAEGRLNRTIVQRTRTEVFTGWKVDLALLKPPIISVDSITYADDTGVVRTLSEEYYYAALGGEHAPRIELAPGFQAPALHFRRHPIAVTYTAGYAEGEVPRAICQWILLALGTMYEHRESVVAGVSVASLPDDFMQLLIQPYMVYE